MNALKQYIELYEQHSDLVQAPCADALNAHREQALETLRHTRLPRKGSEEYHITSLEQMFEPDMGLNLARIPIDVNPAKSFHCGVPNLSSAQLFVLNDTCVVPQGSNLPDAPGVFVGSLAQAAREIPEVVGRYYNSLAPQHDPMVCLDTLFCQDGVMIYVPRGVRLERPVQITSILNNGTPLMAVRRLLVVVEEDAEVKILMCDHTQNNEVDFLSLRVAELFVAADATLDIYDLEESSERTSRISKLYLRQQQRSNVLLNGITLYNGNSRNEYVCDFDGTDSSLRLLGMAIEDRRRQADTYTVVRHNSPRCHTDELFKYVIDDEARGAFSGDVYVAPGACGTEAFQSNRNLVGSDHAKMYSKPRLEIYNDDVKCSHGAATGTLDEMQLFYMRSRGLSLQQARLLLKQAFMADVIDGVRLPALRDRLVQLVENRFAGNAASCSECAACEAKPM